MSNRTFLRILEELNWPKIYLVDPKQFETLEGDKVKGLYGISARRHPAISLDKGLRGRVLANTIYHELSHHLFPARHHWWIECLAERMAGGGGRGYYSVKYGHSVDEMPSRAKCLQLMRKAVKRYNEHN